MDMSIINLDNLKDISRANQLLCRLIRLDNGSISGVQNITDEKWSQVIECAERMELTGVLYHRLKAEQGWNKIPEHIHARLYRDQLVNGARGVIYQNSLCQLLRAFSERGIAVIVLKGAFLAEVIYQDLSERMMGDIDLLAPKASFDLAVDLLRSEGYRSQLEYQAEEGFIFTKEAPPFEKEGHPAVDLHWDLISPGSPFSIDLTGVWQRAQKVTTAGSTLTGLSCEDLLLYLCLHAIDHRLRLGLRAIFDIAMTVNTYSKDMNWQIFISRAQSWKAERCAFIMLRLAVDLFGAPVPQNVLSSLQPDNYDPAFLTTAYSLLILDDSQTSIIRENVIKWHNASSFLGKMRIVLHRFFPPVTEISFQFGVSPESWRAWLYYPLRWRYLFSQYAGTVRKLWRGEQVTQDAALVSAERYEKEDQLYLWLIS